MAGADDDFGFGDFGFDNDDDGFDNDRQDQNGDERATAAAGHASDADAGFAEPHQMPSDGNMSERNANSAPQAGAPDAPHSSAPDRLHFGQALPPAQLLLPLLEALEGMGAVLQDVVVAIEKGEGRERLARERPNWPIRTLACIDIVDGRVEIIG